MPTQATCPHCRAPLSELSRRAGTPHCGAARCRQAADEQRAAALRQAAAAALLAALPASPRPLVVWLKHHNPRTVPLSDDERARHAAYLESVLDDNIVIDRSRLAESTADDSHPQGARLCGHCRGRCCEHGAAWNAFIDLTVLQRWQRAHPGQSTADAVQAYLSLLPDRHAEHGCLYQTEQGCAVPRGLRADICNGFACPPLQQVQAAAAADRERPVLALGFRRDTVERAALITEHGTRFLPATPA